MIEKHFKSGIRGLAVAASLLAAPAFAAGGDPAATGTLQPLAETRYVFQLSYADAEDAIGEALRQKGAGDKISAVITGHSDTPLFSYNQPLTVQIRGLKFDKPTHRWSASLLFVAGGDVVSAIPTAGHYDEMLEVPVLKREVRFGEIITAADLEVRDFPFRQTRNDTITDMSELIGKSPVRGISPERPIREAEVSRPAIVKKNGIVQMHYRSPGMEITVTGQAMNNGAKGDVIDVKNTNSHKIVRGVIEDAETVNIIAPDMETSLLTGGPYATAY